MKPRLALLTLLSVLAFTGCIAIPPLINVHHSESSKENKADKERIEELEKRVRDLERQLQERH
jgi:hypothetical protein